MINCNYRFVYEGLDEVTLREVYYDEEGQPEHYSSFVVNGKPIKRLEAAKWPILFARDIGSYTCHK